MSFDLLFQTSTYILVQDNTLLLISFSFLPHSNAYLEYLVHLPHLHYYQFH